MKLFSIFFLLDLAMGKGLQFLNLWQIHIFKLSWHLTTHSCLAHSSMLQGYWRRSSLEKLWVHFRSFSPVWGPEPFHRAMSPCNCLTHPKRGGAPNEMRMSASSLPCLRTAWTKPVTASEAHSSHQSWWNAKIDEYISIFLKNGFSFEQCFLFLFAHPNWQSTFT